MNDQSTDPGKRRLIKGALLGAGAAAVAPSEWTTPAVRQMFSPAHAQTVSAAAGSYTGKIEVPPDVGEVPGFPEIPEVIVISFDWPGGGGERELDDVTVTFSEMKETGPLTIALSDTLPTSNSGEYFLIELTDGTTPAGVDFYALNDSPPD